MNYNNVIIIFSIIICYIPSYTYESVFQKTNNHVKKIISNNYQQITNMTMDSVILLQGSNEIALLSSNKNIRGVLAHFDWDKIPNLGVSKKEIHTIKILRRQHYIYNSNTICFIPDLWSFQAKNWELQYDGEIPYLENLQFLDNTLVSNLTTHTQIHYTQNAFGFFQDQESRQSGIYSALMNLQTNIINKILIISLEENKKMETMRKQFDTPTSTNISPEPMTVNTNIITNISPTK